NPRSFRVANVDDDGVEQNYGVLEVRDNDLLFHHSEQPAPIRWPLKSLRRYGFDGDLFSFESGRRCATGPGIYAFRCGRSELLFQLVQE
ncbi:hypothetical protein HELRODRAFT_137354, partial [Helobdella robusta]|uniref:IRS-type PTB domain-containing protein n=1 Tax=Helobdella robusta TaxID=6412 RepID=T1EIJ9_HELRO